MSVALEAWYLDAASTAASYTRAVPTPPMDTFLCEYCPRKKQLRDRDDESDESLGLNDSSSEEGQ